ncbi:MAG TPA: FKBP-type peptidyl-prolyl cis-trans isomerase [Vicinamibacterales bacterium]|nr:FKBP-type peptidyl-prolyl cis-trans isomerase [Vicinamibacterales bacterium]
MKQFLACVALALLTIGCGDNGGGLPTDPSQVVIAFTTTDLVVGAGAEAAAGNAVTVDYTGWLYNPAGTDSKGTQFDTSLQAGRTPLPVAPLGSAQVIPGFQQAIVGMRIGGKRRAYIPASLAYGAAGRAPQIPPNAALVFEIELVSVQ